MSKFLKFPVSEAKNNDLYQRMRALGLNEKMLEESTFKTVKSGGKAGMIGVMLFHPPSGIRVRCQRERSQGLNRFLARRSLVEILEKKACHASAPPPDMLDPPNLPTEPPQVIRLAAPPAHWGLA